jgi:nucleotide-binding universal stress UspA family protein
LKNSALLKEKTMFKKILFPTDGSEASLRAAEIVATRAASQGSAQVTVAIVIHPVEPEDSDFDVEFVKASNAQMHRNAECALQKVSDVFSRYKVACTAKTLLGDPVSAVVAKEALDGDYDLIAMSSRGQGLQQDRLGYMGKVIEHVVRRVSIPVLVLPVQEENRVDD